MLLKRRYRNIQNELMHTYIHAYILTYAYRNAYLEEISIGTSDNTVGFVFVPLRLFIDVLRKLDRRDSNAIVHQSLSPVAAVQVITHVHG